MFHIFPVAHGGYEQEEKNPHSNSWKWNKRIINYQLDLKM